MLRTKDDVYKDSGDKFQNMFEIKVSKHLQFCNFYITLIILSTETESTVQYKIKFIRNLF